MLPHEPFILNPDGSYRGPDESAWVRPNIEGYTRNLVCLDRLIGRFVQALKDFLAQSQFLLITHNQHTIASSGIVYGVTMPEKGVSRILSMRLPDIGVRDLDIATEPAPADEPALPPKRRRRSRKTEEPAQPADPSAVSDPSDLSDSSDPSDTPDTAPATEDAHAAGADA